MKIGQLRAIGYLGDFEKLVFSSSQPQTSRNHFLLDNADESLITSVRGLDLPRHEMPGSEMLRDDRPSAASSRTTPASMATPADLAVWAKKGLPSAT
ncbi:hypothetical protein PG990_009071 [Apiospora arundinis]